MKSNFIQTSIDDKTNNFFSFKTECDCCAHDLSVIIDKDETLIEMTLYDKVYIGEDYITRNWFRKLMFKFKCAFKCLFCDGFEIEHGFIFKGRDHLKQFQKYMNERIDFILKD